MITDNEQRTTVTIHGGENILDELQNVLDDPHLHDVCVLGESGNLSQIIGESSLSTAMGVTMLRLEVEHGTLYLDPDSDFEISTISSA